MGRQRGSRRSRRQRGAAAAEYALALGLLVVASIGAIDALTTRAGDNVAAHGASAGAPDLPDAGIPTTTPTTATPPPTTLPTLPPPTVVAEAAITSTSLGVARGGNVWNPRIDVEITDAATGDLVIGATVTVTWTALPSGEVTVSAPCSVPSTGVCSFQLSNLENRSGRTDFVDTVHVEVTAVTGSNPVIQYAPATPVGVDLDAPNH